MRSGVFEEAFIECLFPRGLTELKVREFVTLKHELRVCMSTVSSSPNFQVMLQRW